MEWDGSRPVFGENVVVRATKVNRRWIEIDFDESFSCCDCHRKAVECSIQKDRPVTDPGTSMFYACAYNSLLII